MTYLEQVAAANGYTQAVAIEAGMSDLAGWVKPGTDYDDRFVMICGDTGERLTVSGWSCIVKEG